MNKMHFYCFSTFFVQRISRIFLYVLNRRQRRRTRNLYIIVAAVSSYFCAFLRILWLILVAHPGARTWCHALLWWAVCCSLSSRTAAAVNKKYLDYDVSSRRWGRTTAKAVPGAGEGLSKLGQFDMSEYELVL